MSIRNIISETKYILRINQFHRIEIEKAKWSVTVVTDKIVKERVY